MSEAKKFYLWHVKPNQVIHLESDLEIGREEGDLILSDDAQISSKHAKLTLSNDKWCLYDLGSTNGTFLNGKEIEKKQLIPLNPFNLITLGEHHFVCLDDQVTKLKDRNHFLELIKNYTPEPSSFDEIKGKSLVFMKVEFKRLKLHVAIQKQEMKIERALVQKKEKLAPYQNQIAKIEQEISKANALMTSQIDPLYDELNKLKAEYEKIGTAADSSGSDNTASNFNIEH